MALIKGPKLRPSDEEPEPKKDKQQEEQQRKGGLIKRTTLTGTLPLDSALSPEYAAKARQKQQMAGGKVLKAKFTSIQKPEDEEQEGEDSSGIHDTNVRSGSDFQPASFMTQPGGVDGHGQARNMVMIPTTDKPPQPPAKEEPQPADDGEFQVEQPNQMSSVDVEALIAEAEQKGREKAAKIIEHAQAEAKKLIDQAKIYGETAKSEAHREGMKQGKEDGYREGLAQFTAMMEEAKKLINQIITERQKVLEAAEPELASLSIDIAKKIIGAEIETNPEVTMNVVKEAVSKMKSREQVTIKVHPDDLEHVQENRDVFMAIIEGIRELTIETDNRVDRGGCLIETNLGNTDARISTQIGAIELAFKRAETGTF